jgi:hypothetical protein
VASQELIRYYESLVAKRKTPADANRYLREYVAEILDAWEARVILRDLRSRAGIATCIGEVDCLEGPTSVCMRGEHPTCPDHTDSCYLCLPRRCNSGVSWT